MTEEETMDARALRDAVLTFLNVNAIYERRGYVDLDPLRAALAAARRDPEPVASTYIGFWTPDGEVIPVVVDYTRPLLREATKHGRDSMTVSGFVWTFTAIEAAIRGTEARASLDADALLEEAVSILANRGGYGWTDALDVIQRARVILAEADR